MKNVAFLEKVTKDRGAKFLFELKSFFNNLFYMIFLSASNFGLGDKHHRPLQLVCFVSPIEVLGKLDPLSFHKLRE